MDTYKLNPMWHLSHWRYETKRWFHRTFPAYINVHMNIGHHPFKPQWSIKLHLKKYPFFSFMMGRGLYFHINLTWG